MSHADTRPAACPYAAGDPRTAGRPDPCREYLVLRQGDPVRHDEQLGVWVVTGHDEVRRLLGHPLLSSEWQRGGRTRLHEESGFPSHEARTSAVVRRWFMFQDGARHAEARRVVAPLFSARRVAALRPFVRDLVAGLVPEGGGTLDIMGDVAVPLSSHVICRLLGLPADVAPLLDDWAGSLAALLIADYRPGVVERGHRTLDEIAEVIDRVGADAAFPEGSGLALLRAAHRSGAIEADDVHATAALLVYAGFETTSTFIGKAVRAVLHSRSWAQLDTAEPGDLVEELLRFDTSVGQVARLALGDIETSGGTIAEGDLVLLMLGTADRDPGAFPAPDLLTPGRPTRRHLAFGHGIHYCLGAGLARLEATAVLERLGAVWRDAEAVPAPPGAGAGSGPGHALRQLWVRGESARAATGA
ncbi:MAG: cytochrome P450 [Kitasatospora sp.]|jgi:cytochrome P450|nr:cytochrome P450 [Kitasatospora sp.]